MGTEEAEASRLAGCNQRYVDSLLRSQVLSSTGQAVPAFFLSLGALILLLYGGHLVIKGQMTLGALVAFSAYQGRLISPIKNLMGLYLGIQRAGVSLERVFELLDQQPYVKEAIHPISLSCVRGEVELRGVSFHYEPGQETLHDIDLLVRAGSRLAIIGPTGAGKTTLMELLLRFYDPQQGQILLDGHDLRELRFKTLRANIAVITHEPCLFHATIEENIRYGSPHATTQDIYAAAHAADIHEFILSLPQGYQTVVGERGVGLSAGQRQRIAIARAILKKAKVWLFDEATATLDVLTESRIREAMDRWLGEHTSIIVTHRLSSVVDMDRIVVMEAGPHHAGWRPSSAFEDGRPLSAASPRSSAPPNTLDPRTGDDMMSSDLRLHDKALQQATGRNVKVAVIDSGINAHHSHVRQISGGVKITCDASGEIAFSDDYRDYDGHGTAVAGIIRAKAPDVALYSVKILQDRLRTESRVLAAAIRSCIANDMRVINMSLGTHQASGIDALRQACEAAAEGKLSLSPQVQRSAFFQRVFMCLRRDWR